jgi:hypothetical protein
MSLKKIQAREKYLKEQKQHEECRTLAIEKFGEEEFIKMKKANPGLFFLPIMNNEGEIQKMALMKPVDPHITKICAQAYVKAAMQECFIEGDKDILEENEFQAQAAEGFLEIMKSKKLRC